MLLENIPLKKRSLLGERSNEHRESLLFYWKLKQGLGDGTNVIKLKDLTLAYWQDHMKNHFIREEEILLPLISCHLLAEQLRKDHKDIQDLIRSVSKTPTTNLFSILAAFIANHIRFEEGWLFSYLEKTFSQEELREIADKLGKY